MSNKKPVDGPLLLVAFWVFLRPAIIFKELVSGGYFDYTLAFGVLVYSFIAWIFWTEKSITAPIVAAALSIEVFFGASVFFSVAHSYPLLERVLALDTESLMLVSFTTARVALGCFFVAYMLRSNQVKARFTESLSSRFAG